MFWLPYKSFQVRVIELVVADAERPVGAAGGEV